MAAWRRLGFMRGYQGRRSMRSLQKATRFDLDAIRKGAHRSTTSLCFAGLCSFSERHRPQNGLRVTLVRRCELNEQTAGRTQPSGVLEHAHSDEWLDQLERVGNWLVRHLR
jgi:hypothetical protein